MAGAIQLVIVAVNFSLPGKLHVREQLGTAPRFIRQIFYATFWSSRLAVQGMYYDRDMRCANRRLDSLYLAALVTLSIVFALAAGLGGSHGWRW